MLRNDDQLATWDRENFFHPSTHLAQHARGESATRVITGASGVHIEDRDGNRMLDAFAGLYCVNAGYGRTEVADAIAEQAHQLAYYHSYVGHGTETSITLAKMIMDRAPAHMSKVYFGLSGSDANETNIKLVWYYNNRLGRPQKKKIISRWRGYHGSGLMTGSLTGLSLFHDKFDLPMNPVIHTDAPYFYRRKDRTQSEAEFTAQCANALEALIQAEGPDTIAAFIGEPVLGTGGIVPPPAGYWGAIHEAFNRHDILLIAGEVVTGFGRPGTIVSDRMWKVLEQGTDENGPIGHGWTYSAHPICAAAGVANLKLIDDLNLVSNAAEVGGYLNASMKEALDDHPNVGDIRGEGLLCAVEYVADKADATPLDPAAKVGAAISAAMLERGVIARAMPQGDITGFAPPFCITRAEVDTVVAATADAVKTVLG